MTQFPTNKQYKTKTQMGLPSDAISQRQDNTKHILLVTEMEFVTEFPRRLYATKYYTHLIF